MAILVKLKFGDGDFQQGFSGRTSVITIRNPEGQSREIKIQLPSAPEIPVSYEKWLDRYGLLTNTARIAFKRQQVTNFSWSEYYQECEQLAQDLLTQLNDWLFGIKSQLETVIQLKPDSEIIFIIDTQGIKSQSTKNILYRLPWREWDYFSGSYFLETALYFNEPQFKIKPIEDRGIFRRVKITSIFGDNQNIDIQTDRELIEKLQQRGAELTFLSQPQRPDFIKLWEQPCDIIFYSGHSQTDRTNQVGYLQINHEESLNPEEIQNTFRQAIAFGLKLAIFNSCDGLGLAEQLANLGLPYIIVWREAVPDKIAQDFLKYFLRSFSQGKSLFASVRDARIQLQELTNTENTENQIPGVNWLPIICQNTLDTPPNWKDLGGLTGKLPDSPYQGLCAFKEEDAPIFFGRDKFIADLVNSVKTKPLVGVVGASGSGKSSLVFAGLVPQLRAAGNIQIVSFRPGKNPFDALAMALKSHLQSLVELQDGEAIQANNRRLKELESEVDLLDRKQGLCELITNLVACSKIPPKSCEDVASYVSTRDNEVADNSIVEISSKQACDQSFVLIADQFEELYTLTTSEQRRSFLDALLYAVKFAPDCFTLAFTLRADFMGKALDYQPMGEALQKYPPILLTSMNREELAQAIEKPAEKMKVELEPGLTAKLIDDLGQQPGRLPLLEFTLTQLWQKPNKWYLTHQAYEEIGGLEKALAKYADSVLNLLSAAEKSQAERIFMQLVRPGEGTEDTKRIATRNEVNAYNWDLVKRLADERLVITAWDESNQIETVEIIHEALIREWGQLRQWIDKDRNFRAWQERLRVAMYQWQETPRDEGALLRGAALVEAQEKLKQHQDNLSQPEQEFIQQSLGLQSRLKKEEEKRKRLKLQQARRIAIIASAAVLFLVGLSSSIFFLWQRSEKQKVNAQILSQTLKSENLLASDSELDALVEGLKVGKKVKKLGKNIEAGRRIRAIANLQQLVYGTREINRLEGYRGSVNSISLSSDGKIIASAHYDGTVILWRKDGKKLKILKGHSGPVYSVDFSSDNKSIASASDDGTIKLWSTDGKLIKTIKGHNGRVYSVSFSPNGNTIASASNDHTIKLWSKNGTLLKTLKGHSGSVNSVSFSPVSVATPQGFGNIIASASNDRTIKLWSTDGTLLKTLKGHSGSVNSVSFSPVSVATPQGLGNIIVSASRDSTVKLWSTNGTELNTLKGHSGPVYDVSFSRDGNTIASASWDDTVKLWSTDGTELKTLKGQHFVNSVSFAPRTVNTHGTLPLDGKNPVKAASPEVTDYAIASGSWDGTVKLWSQEGTELKTLKGHNGPVNSVSFMPSAGGASSPDGNIIASAGWDNTVKLWSKDGTQLGTLTGHSGQVNSISFSPSPQGASPEEIGSTIASASDDGTVKLWSKDGRLLKTFEGHSAPVNSVSFSPVSVATPQGFGKTIVSASDDSTIKLWSTDGRLLKTFKKHGTSINSVNFSPDSTTIVSASDDGTIDLWTKDGTLLKSFKGHGGSVNSVNFSPDSTTIVSASDDGTVKLWNKDGKLLKTFEEEHSGSINSAGFSPDGNIIASASYDGTVKLWNKDGTLLKTLSSELFGNEGHYRQVSSVSFSSDGNIIASASYDGTVKLWNKNGKLLKTLKGHPAPVYDASFAPPTASFPKSLIGKASPEDISTIIASASYDGTVKLWNRNGTELKTLKGHKDSVHSVSFSPNGKTIASASYDGTVKLWSIDGAILKTLQGHSYSVNSVSFSPDSKTIVSGSDDGTVKLWSIDGAILKTFKGHDDSVNSVSFSPNGKIIASASNDRTLKLWSIDGRELKTIQGDNHKVNSISFSPDGNTIASASDDGTVKLWSKEGRKLKTLKEHHREVYSVSFSSDGNIIVSGGWDGTVKLWAKDGTQLKTLKGHTGPINSVSFSPDGKTIVSTSNDNTVRLWNLDLDDLLVRGCNLVRDYLKNNPNVSREDRGLCDDGVY